MFNFIATICRVLIFLFINMDKKIDYFPFLNYTIIIKKGGEKRYFSSGVNNGENNNYKK